MTNLTVSAEAELFSTPNPVTIAPTNNQEIKFNNTAYKQNITIEAAYTVSDETAWTGDCNIPFIVMSGTTQLGRVSIYSKDAKILATRVEGNGIINTGSVDRSGSFLIEVDYTNSELLYKYKGSKYKPEVTLIKQPFSTTTDAGITGLKIGAGGNPGVTVAITVHDGITDDYKTVYDFEAEYQGSLKTYFDYQRSDEAVVISQAPDNASNKAVKIPSGSKMDLFLMPIDYGFSGLVSLKTKVYVSGESTSNFSIVPTEYITGKTYSLATMNILESDLLCMTCNKEKRYIQSGYSYLNRWFEVEYIVDTNTDTIKAYVDNKPVNLTAKNGEETTATLPIADEKGTGIVNRLVVTSTEGDIYLDDITIAEIRNIELPSSGALTVDNEKREISGFYENATAEEIISGVTVPEGMVLKAYNADGTALSGVYTPNSYIIATDSKGIYGVKYTLKSLYSEEYVYSEDFEDEIAQDASGGDVVESFYGRNDWCYKSKDVDYGTMKLGFTPISTGFVSIEFDMLMETNTSFSGVSILNSLEKPVARLYLENEEKIAFMTYDPEKVEDNKNVPRSHIISTWNKQWVRVRADVDTVNHNVMWYINNRPLSTTPVNLTDEYMKDKDSLTEGYNVISTVGLGYRKGVSVYADNLTVYTQRNEAITPSSTLYTVDETYKMITGVLFGTTTSELLGNVTPLGRVYSRSGRVRSSDEIILPGDTIQFTGANNVSKYAIGLENGAVNPSLYEQSVEVYVSPTGDDAADGSIQTPFETLDKAVAAVKQTGKNAAIYLREGIYNISDTVNISNCKNLTIKAYNNEEAVLVGGKVLTFEAAENDAALERLDADVRDKIVVADITGVEVGGFTQAGWDLPFRRSKAVLTKNGETQTLARYPNTGCLTSISNETDKSFVYSEAEPDTWQFNDKIYVWGFFGTSYGGFDIRVSDISNKTVTVGGDMYGSAKKPFEYYFFNVFEELDSPGEYYIDEENHKVYYYPKEGYDTQRMVLGSAYSTIIRIQESDNVNIENIIFEGGRENAIEMNDCINTVVKNCDIQGFGMNGVEIVGGLQCGVEGCEISNIGADAVKLSAGDMYTLTPAKHFVRNCNIHDFSKRKTSYTSAVTTAGDGFEISGNVIHSSPHMGLYLRASNVDIHDNNFYDLVQNAKDAGAIYSVDTYTRRGVNIYNNAFENIYNIYEPDGVANVKCIYLDNFTSGWRVYNNIFKNSDEGIHLNGGRENEIYDNVFVNMKSAMNIQNLKDLTFAAAPYYQIDYYPLSSSLWKERFSGIDEFTTVNKGYPNNTRVTDNVVSRVGRAKVDRNPYMKISDHKTISAAAATADGGILDYEMYKNLIAPIEPINQRGFKVGSFSPMASAVYIEKGTSEEVYYFDGAGLQVPDSIKSSNETRVSVKDNTIYAVGDGGAYITLNYQGIEKQIYVATSKSRLGE